MYSVQSKESCIKVSFRPSGVFCQIVHTPACIGRTFSQELKLYLLNVLKMSVSVVHIDMERAITNVNVN